MYLSRLSLNRGRIAVNWAANFYRVHQRLKMACEGDARVLFRVEEAPTGMRIIVQSHLPPNWNAAFGEFAVLSGPAECKSFEPRLEAGQACRFRLLANPTVKRDGKRQGLLHVEDQQAWLVRKLAAAGMQLVQVTAMPQGLQYSSKGSQPGTGAQTHLAVLFEGLLRVGDPLQARAALEQGIGAAKGYGFGLLSLARA
jgi:CRISPR system Cascade subunit CasE